MLYGMEVVTVVKKKNVMTIKHFQYLMILMKVLLKIVLFQLMNVLMINLLYYVILNFILLGLGLIKRKDNYKVLL